LTLILLEQNGDKRHGTRVWTKVRRGFWTTGTFLSLKRGGGGGEGFAD